MNCTSQRLTYRQTGIFSKIVLDYLDDTEQLRSFYSHRPDKEGILNAITERKKYPTNRNVLVEYLKKQYSAVPVSEKVIHHIDLLLQENTFTVTTAHQPNLFTGPLYFIYKIIHVIKLADELNKQIPENNFIPVYYVGSEDADFEELSHCTVNGTTYQWTTDQSGAFGRMIIDKEITKLIDAISGELLVHPFGKEITDALRSSFQEKTTIKAATFSFVHFLFEKFGLIVLIADAKELKQEMIPVFEDELLNQSSEKLVKETTTLLEQHFKVQASGRAINLFYFDEDLRERIEKTIDGYAVANSTIRFTKDEMLKEVKEHPERFSPNVITRALYQEMILPNILFIGGGGEQAYWFELKKVFDFYKVPFPVLALRNSFLIIEKKWNDKITKLGFNPADFFLTEDELLNSLVKKNTKNEIRLNGTISEAEKLYENIKQQVSLIDTTLAQHVDALKTKTLFRLKELEKKMLRAEKRKYADQKRQIQQIKQHLFPGNGLQERKESFLGFYAKWGDSFIDELVHHSPTLEQEFIIVNES
jgi:bacillithiol synthase